VGADQLLPEQTWVDALRNALRPIEMLRFPAFGVAHQNVLGEEVDEIDTE
jgi:hypothetical protein